MPILRFHLRFTEIEIEVGFSSVLQVIFMYAKVGEPLHEKSASQATESQLCECVFSSEHVRFFFFFMEDVLYDLHLVLNLRVSLSFPLCECTCELRDGTCGIQEDSGIPMLWRPI